MHISQHNCLTRSHLNVFDTPFHSGIVTQSAAGLLFFGLVESLCPVEPPQTGVEPSVVTVLFGSVRRCVLRVGMVMGG